MADAEFDFEQYLLLQALADESGEKRTPDFYSLVWPSNQDIKIAWLEQGRSNYGSFPVFFSKVA